MSRRGSACKALALSLVLLTTLATMPPVAAAEVASPAAAVIGSVTSVGTVELRGVNIERDATLFAGDVVRSHANGYAKLSLTEGHQVELRADTRVTLGQADSSVVQLALAAGSVSFNATGRSPLMIQVAPFELTMTDAGAGAVGLRGAETLGVRANKGVIRVRNTANQESFTLTPGQERLFNRGTGVQSKSLGEVVSTLPGPIPLVPPLDPAPQLGSGLSNSAWIAIVAAVGGAAALGAYFAGRSGRVPEEDLDQANAEIADLQGDVSALGSQVTSLNTQIATLNAQIAALESSNVTLANELIAERNAAEIELSAVRSQFVAAQTALVAEQLQDVVASSSASASDKSSLNSQAQDILNEIESREDTLKSLTEQIASVRADILVTPLSADPDVKGSHVQAPPGSSAAKAALFDTLNTLTHQLETEQIALNAARVELVNLLNAAQSTPGIDATAMAELQASVPPALGGPPIASFSEPS